MLIALLVWVAVRRGVQPVLMLGLLGAASMSLVQLAASPSIDPLYDIKPMALAIKQVQTEGRTVANAARYHAQYQFLGRLEAPLVELKGADLKPWLAAHPNDFVVVYLKDTQKLDAFTARYKQAYRGGAAVLVDTRTAAGLLAADIE